MKKTWQQNALWLIISLVALGSCKTQPKEANKSNVEYAKPGSVSNLDSLKKIQQLKRDSVLNPKN